MIVSHRVISEPFNLAKRVLIVAEIGNNHEGSFDTAQRMIASAAKAGADAVKFQTFVPEHYVHGADSARLARLRGFQFSYAQFEALARTAQDSGVMFFSTPFDIQSAHFLNSIQDVFKIASGDNNFMHLIKTVAGFAKPMFVSTGLADLDLLQRIYSTTHTIWQQKQAKPAFAFLHCVCSYPAPPAQANLGAIKTLQVHFPGATVGYSDHTLGIQAATFAVAAGARIIEKHFTLDKNYSEFRDHQLSADPQDFQQLVAGIRLVEELQGAGEISPQPCEEVSRAPVRRSIAAASDLAAGTMLTAAHITWVRPGTGIPPGEVSAVLGRTITRSLAQGEMIVHKDLYLPEKNDDVTERLEHDNIAT